MYTHILNEREALILVVVKPLLLSQVFVLGRLKTHGYHLRAGQHLAPFAAISTLPSKRGVDPVPVFLFVLVSPCGG